jgi:hypothetical protein
MAELSVVVALISGRKEDLARCLTALTEQQVDPPTLEILVPFDEPVREVTKLAERFPQVRFIEAEGLDTRAARAGASREHHDTLRTLGLRAASGRIVALTEDHAVASSTWCSDMLRLLDEKPQLAAIGGAVECGSDRLLNRAVYYCDFGRYQNPLTEGPAEFVSDSNVAYRREALESVASAWEDDYHETMVHWALVEKGLELWLTPRSEVHQTRHDLGIGEALLERQVWGRSFAGTRVRGVSLVKRALFAALSFLLPFVLTWRVLRGARARGRASGRMLATLPWVFVLHCAWAWGEFVGYVTGNPGHAS